MSVSDWQFLGKLQSGDSLDTIGLYKACAAIANNGGKRAEEFGLPEQCAPLLDARRMLKNGTLNEAFLRLETARPDGSDTVLNILLEGDTHALRALYFGRLGKFAEGQREANFAAQTFARIPDNHRALRALINAEIFRCNLDTFTVGGLYSLEQRARRLNFHDLVGNVQKARAVQLMNAGKFEEAIPEALDAVRSYELDGCPEDRSVAECILAILYLLVGKIPDAQASIGKVHFRDGKVTVYYQAYQSLVVGKTPQIPKQHPLNGTPWPVHQVKRDSVSGKLLRRLSVGPASRDELIREIWGAGALHPSYCARLYTVINHLRRKNQQSIVFDGNVYRLN